MWKIKNMQTKEGGKYDVFIEIEDMEKMKISGMIAINDWNGKYTIYTKNETI